MVHSTARLLAGTLIPLLVACSESPPTSIENESDPPASLSVLTPSLDPGSLALFDAEDGRMSVDGYQPGVDGPMASEGDESSEQPARVFDARTRVGFTGGGAYAEGFHRFNGHGGRIETRAEVTFDGSVIGSQTAIMQRSWWLGSWGSKFLTAYAPVFTDVSCGLTVRGNSIHSAWLELFSGRSAPKWAEDVQSTYARPASNGQCNKWVSEGDPSGEHTDPAGVVCYYLVTYDLETLVIVDVRFLSCQSGGDSGDLI